MQESEECFPNSQQLGPLPSPAQILLVEPKKVRKKLSKLLRKCGYDQGGYGCGPLSSALNERSARDMVTGKSASPATGSLNVEGGAASSGRAAANRGGEANRGAASSGGAAASGGAASNGGAASSGSAAANLGDEVNRGAGLGALFREHIITANRDSAACAKCGIHSAELKLCGRCAWRSATGLHVAYCSKE